MYHKLETVTLHASGGRGRIPAEEFVGLGKKHTNGHSTADALAFYLQPGNGELQPPSVLGVSNHTLVFPDTLSFGKVKALAWSRSKWIEIDIHLSDVPEFSRTMLVAVAKPAA